MMLFPSAILLRNCDTPKELRGVRPLDRKVDAVRSLMEGKRFREHRARCKAIEPYDLHLSYPVGHHPDWSVERLGPSWQHARVRRLGGTFLLDTRGHAD